ncbi:hypothetical protein [Saccharothrix sp. Mg75]|uniref:hypothetical protein n=1 Tax=Saccharothrix sp. Mg75 TaxID=3445357 RepID=UPI003EE85348
MSTGDDDLDLTPPRGTRLPAAEGGWSVAPAVIGGELPEPEPLPPAAPPTTPPVAGPDRGDGSPAGSAKRSFLDRLLRRDG